MLTLLFYGLVSGGGNSALAPPSYPATLLDMRNDVKTRLNLPQDTPAAQFSGGDGAAVVLTSDQVITGLINDGFADLCRSCYPYYGERSMTVSSRVVTFADMTQGTGVRVWAVEDCTWNGVSIRHTSVTALRQWKSDYLTATGTPIFWFEIGTAAIGLYQAPSTPGTLLVSGLAIPALLVNSTDFSPLAPDLNNLIVFYACAKICEKADNNPDLKQRAPIWLDAYEQGVQSLLLGLWKDDPDFAGKHFGPPAQPSSPLTGTVASAQSVQQPQGG